MDLKNLKKIQTLDLEQFAFADSKIEIVEVKDYSTPEIQKLRLLIQTEILKENTKLRASLFINLFKNSEGELGFSDSKTSTATKVLTHFNIDDFEKLKGLPCKVVVTTRDNGQKNLTIFFGK